MQYVNRTICTGIIVQRGYIFIVLFLVQLQVGEQLKMLSCWLSGGTDVVLPAEKGDFGKFLPGSRGNKSRLRGFLARFQWEKRRMLKGLINDSKTVRVLT